MAIVPDTSDWTWVLERPCADCGLRAGEVPFADLPALIRANAAAWIPVLARVDAAVRPSDHTWSALEYAAHVRDCCRLFDERLRRALDEDDPQLADWDQDATAIAARYDLQDPVTVSRELEAAAASVADSFAAVEVGDRRRSMRRSDGASFTVETLGQYFLHDIVHHRHDVNG
ncbi:DinB family protein [Cryobacterium melibiosiphilum]|uniref:DinB family protein n=1 Tax=Cryobacterium melibiosiphilum TaxID=995039 RepID=A0A3A5MVC6_9MICO|nr:DinB family protein [Cryobacterium melibiosiphilum]RJT91193.1 DinB family protein [Cryobacterium melibiosiphilum]